MSASAPVPGSRGRGRRSAGAAPVPGVSGRCSTGAATAKESEAKESGSSRPLKIQRFIHSKRHLKSLWSPNNDSTWAELVVEMIRRCEDNWAGKVIRVPRRPRHIGKWMKMVEEERADDDLVYIELGREQEMYYTGKERMQVTLRDIRVAEELQNQKILTRVVYYLLNTYGCVQLEAVCNLRLSKKLAESKKWTAVGGATPGDRGTSYYRLLNAAEDADWDTFRFR